MKVVASLALVTAVMATSVAAAGTGSGTSKGFGGDITVTVTVSGGKITDVKYNCDNETPGDEFGQNACKVLAGNLKGQSGVSLDTVSGASYSSKGFIAAAQSAYDAAKAADTTAATTTTAAPETTKAPETTPAPETTKSEEKVDSATESSEGGLNVPLVGGIIVVIALVGFFGFKKFGPKEK